MALPGDERTRAHGILGGIPFKIDQNAPEEIGRPGHAHIGRSLFRPGTDISGRPGAQNLREERLIWHITDWDGGEGQTVLRNGDDASARKFYRSEGLDFRVPGKVMLNQSTVASAPPDASGGGSSDIEGSVFTDVTGVSTVVNTTDRRLEVAADVVESTSFTPGASQTQARVYLYKETPATTTIEGSEFLLKDGVGHPTGSNFKLTEPGSMAGTVILPSTGTQLYKVTFTLNATALTTQYSAEVKLLIVDTTNTTENIITSTVITIPNRTTASLDWVPVAGRNYRARVRWLSKTGSAQDVIIDNITHGKADTPTSVTVFVRNHTDGNTTNLPTQTVQLQNTTSAQALTLNYTGVAAKAYRVRVQYNSGAQRPTVDKVTHNVQTTTPWSLDDLELGQGARVWLVGHRAGVDNQLWYRDHATEDWTLSTVMNAITATGSVSVAMAHTDLYEYILDAGGEVTQATTSVDVAYTDARTGANGMAICQNRLFILRESTGAGRITVEVFPIDQTAGLPLTSATAGYQTAKVTDAQSGPDTDLRQVMTPTPTGARFFVNYSNVSCVVYEADTSGSALVVREITRLDVGARATAICYVAGSTFIAGQFHGETGKIPRTALWVIDQNGVLRKVGTFRRDDPINAIVSKMQPYENDLWILQGKAVWRFPLSLLGGLFLEYQLDPPAQSYQRAIAVLQGHTFALFNQSDANNVGGVTWVTGSVGTYRQSAVADGNSFTTSIQDFGLPGVNKLLRRIQVVSDEMAANTAIHVHYQTDQSGTWVEVGTHSAGSASDFTISDAFAAVEFNSVQVRVTLSSTTGVGTPKGTAIIVEALPSEFEEFVDLMILTEDEDANFHTPDTQRSGGDISQAIFGLWRAGAPVTLVDGFSNIMPGNNPEYLVRIEDINGSNDEVGEGRLSVRLRVLQ